MAIATYVQLQTAAANWLARDDLILRIPEFIALAEAKLNRSLRCMQQEKREYADVVATNSEPEFISLPWDFQTMRRLRLPDITGKPRLTFLTGTQMDEIRCGNANATGQPIYFTVFGTEIELCPTPDGAYRLEMIYRAMLPALSDTQTDNWLLILAPDAYLYGTMLEAAAYMDNDPRIQTWVTGLSQAVDSLNSLSQEQTHGAGPLSMRLSGVTP